MTPDPAAREAVQVDRPSARIGPWTLLALLLLSYTLNFADRTLLSVLQEPIKREFGLADWQLGLLGGASFALFYSFLGIPIARLSESRSRPLIISAAIATWSVMTMLCGMAGSYAQLFLCRVGVGIGEAGGTPPAHSLISDHFPPERRATAISIYCLGVPFGMLLGALAGGILAEQLGWRWAFLLFGLPGLPLALTLAMLCREPRRAVVAGGDVPPSLRFVAGYLLRIPAFRHLAAGITLASLAGYAIAAFNASYFIRAFDLGPAQAGMIVALAGALSNGVGTWLGGWLADVGGRRDPRWGYWIPALGLALACPLYIIALVQPGLLAVVSLMILPAVFQFFYLGPTYAAAQNLAQPAMRATASALLLFTVNLIGLGLGPLLLGLASDLFASARLGGDFAVVCLDQRQASAVCQDASTVGLRHALMLITLFFLWAAAHYWAAARPARR